MISAAKYSFVKQIEICNKSVDSQYYNSNNNNVTK